jgi:hypothetical protein
MKPTQTLQFYSILVTLKLFAWAMPIKIHGPLVNRLLAFFNQDEQHHIMENVLHELAAHPYDQNRKFSSAEEEADSYLKFAPRMQPYRSILVNIYRNKRQAAGLKEEQKTT